MKRAHSSAKLTSENYPGSATWQAIKLLKTTTLPASHFLVRFYVDQTISIIPRKTWFLLEIPRKAKIARSMHSRGFGLRYDVCERERESEEKRGRERGRESFFLFVIVCSLGVIPFSTIGDQTKLKKIEEDTLKSFDDKNNEPPPPKKSPVPPPPTNSNPVPPPLPPRTYLPPSVPPHTCIPASTISIIIQHTCI